MNYIDTNIPILCAECDTEHIEDGYENFRDHLIQQHGFNIYDAEKYAKLNMQDAYDREESEQFRMTMRGR